MLKQLRNLIAVFALLALFAGVAVAGPGHGAGSPGGDGDPDGPMVIQPIVAANQVARHDRITAVVDGATEVRAKQQWWMKTLRAYLKLSQWFSI